MDARTKKRISARRPASGLADRPITRVRQEIGLRILSGHYQPRETLTPEVELCAELGVSRTALREAIKDLAAKGLLTPRVKVGTIVNPRSQWNFLDPVVLQWLLLVEDVGLFLQKLLELRMALEPGASALAARNASEADRKALHAAYDAMAAATDDFEAWVAADLRFHQAIYFSTGNEFFWPVGSLLEPALLAGFRVTSKAPHHHQECLPEHRMVHDAILARDAAAAFKATVVLMETTEANLASMRHSSFTIGTERPRSRSRSKRRVAT
jgi:DNA-binding FadR family transcriptional regulator